MQSKLFILFSFCPLELATNECFDNNRFQRFCGNVFKCLYRQYLVGKITQMGQSMMKVIVIDYQITTYRISFIELFGKFIITIMGQIKYGS